MSEVKFCPYCGATQRSNTEATCWLCRENYEAQRKAKTPPPLPGFVKPPTSKRLRFLMGVGALQLLSLMMTFAQMGAHGNPIFVLFALILLGILTYFFTTLRKEDGAPDGLGRIVRTILVAAGMMAIVGFAAVIAMFVVCTRMLMPGAFRG